MVIQSTAEIVREYGPFPGADRVNVHHCNCDWHAGNDGFISEAHAILIAQSDVGRRAAHIERNDVRESGRARGAQRTDNSSGRTG